MNKATLPPDNIPELAPSQLLEPLPERIALALDARVMEKAMVAKLVAQWLEALRPEMERMARDIVQQSAETYWRQHVDARGQA